MTKQITTLVAPCLFAPPKRQARQSQTANKEHPTKQSSKGFNASHASDSLGHREESNPRRWLISDVSSGDETEESKLATGSKGLQSTGEAIFFSSRLQTSRPLPPSRKGTGIYFNNVEIRSTVHPLQGGASNQVCRTRKLGSPMSVGRPLPFAPILPGARLLKPRKRSSSTDTSNTISKKQRSTESRPSAERVVSALPAKQGGRASDEVAVADCTVEASVMLEAAVALAELRR